ncbi:hypothetical protein [Streptomyces mexicanus]|uniref:hypothetical protein n=1 Tax=Streptomyces mexicanus TaxID=178566 RepID=UPI0036588462
MPTALVVRVHEELGELIKSSSTTCDVAGDGGGDTVPVLGHALAVTAAYDLSVTAELAVAAGGVATSEVSEEDQVGGGRREVGESQGLGVAASDCLWMGFSWTRSPL